jgi:DNA-binding NarL/FixJ family response regulator
MAYVAARSERPSPSPRTILWLLANPLDCEALGLWCRTHVACDFVETSADLDAGLRRCESSRPRLLVLDPTVSDSALERGLKALRAHTIGHFLVLDRRPREGRLVELLAEHSASYMSRQVGPHALAAAIEEILVQGTRAIDPALAALVRRTPRGYALHDHATNGSVAGLSRRERQVMRLLAQGKTVQQAATTLGLAPSTIDNHKSRLMKKLGIHKASELTCRAVRDGLIVL